VCQDRKVSATRGTAVLNVTDTVSIWAGGPSLNTPGCPRAFCLTIQPTWCTSRAKLLDIGGLQTWSPESFLCPNEIGCFLTLPQNSKSKTNNAHAGKMQALARPFWKRQRYSKKQMQLGWWDTDPCPHISLISRTVSMCKIQSLLL
jgi:hypothetical protein